MWHNCAIFDERSVLCAMKTPALRVAVISALCNIALVAVKYPLGLYFGSGALVSDAVHSLTDVLCNIIVIVGIYLAAKEPDELHNYGHSRFESIASLLLGVILFFAGFSIGKNGFVSVLQKSYLVLESPGWLAFAAAAFSVLLKEFLFRYTNSAADKTGSTALKADARHHRIDSVATAGSIIGMGGVVLGLPVLDPLASIFICLFIIKTAFELFLGASRELVDRACPREIQEKILRCCSNMGLSPAHMRTRICAGKVCCELIVYAEKDSSLRSLEQTEQRLCKAISAAADSDCDIVIRFRSE